MGIHRNFPGEVAVLPRYFLGLGIPDQYVECGMARIIIFINNMGPETLASKFLTYTLQLFQIETEKIEDILL